MLLMAFTAPPDLKEREKQLESWKQQRKGGTQVLEVSEDIIAQIAAAWTGIPVKKLAEEESGRLLRMEETLHKRVIGQDEAISAVSRAVRRARVGLKDPKRPIGSFILRRIDEIVGLLLDLYH